ncbi:MAG: hypothetical protein M3Q19_16450 [Pseudomonadota bacterium]|nr:hypothetical protein [Pseudomonadota bacterium]
MSKLPSLTFAAAALVLPTLVAPTPALAQRVNEIIVYGTDPCPRSTDDEVVVCARKPESERFRIPERFRQSGSLQSRQAWANRAIAFETYGKTGINSCSPVGPGGFTGCSQQLINQAFRERREEEEGAAPPEE